MNELDRSTSSAPIEYRRSETDPMITEQVEQEPKQNDGERSKRVKQITDTTEAFSCTQYLGQHEKENEDDASYSCGRGIIADCKRTLGSHWIEEMINFNQQTIAVSFFLFFACIAPAITFGAIYAKATDNWIGAVEMITATSWCGIVYAILGGQPMMINGGTGPVLAFTEILYKMSETLDVPFLTFNAWIGLWVCGYMCIAAFFDLNRIIIYATRFTDEIFAFLISTIFIINALGNPFAPVGIYYYFESDHASHSEHAGDPDYSHMATALLSLIICIGTVQLAFILRKAKFSSFGPNQLSRNVVTDFAVVVSIVVMTVIAQVLFKDIKTETLNVPDSFAPTYACCKDTCETNWPIDCPELAEPYRRRPWLVDLGDLNGKAWIPLMAAGPAVLAFILVFLDDGITWHLINHPTHKLKHGAAYNYDTLVIGVMIGINSVFGLPWLVAATVRSLNHIHALAEKAPNGKIISVRETRLTHLGVHLLCFASIFALDKLKVIPMPVLYGVFLFMGLVSLGTNQFWGRILMFFMQPSKYPMEWYTEHVKPRRMHLFTIIQLGLFIVLYVVKAIKAIAIAFPIVIALCIPIRLYLLPKVFTAEELVMIDSDDETVIAWLAARKEATKAPEPFESDEEMQQESDGIVQGSRVSADEAEQESEKDQVTPLPTEEYMKHRQERRKHRKKSISCPNNLLFSDAALAAAAAVAANETAAEDTADEDSNASDDGFHMVTVRPRRRRKKTISCPAHTLFAEAENHVSSNYFFG